MLLFIRKIDSNTLLGLWRMDEDEAPAKSSFRQRETICEHLLLKAMTGRDAEIGHEPSGKPILDGFHISISHTKGFVAIILSDAVDVGVDIEYRSDRINRIASRFMRPDEQAADTEQRLIVWCAKEAAYKYFSSDDLTFQQMRVDIEGGEVENLKRHAVLPFSVISEKEYVLVYGF